MNQHPRKRYTWIVGIIICGAIIMIPILRTHQPTQQIITKSSSKVRMSNISMELPKTSKRTDISRLPIQKGNGTYKLHRPNGVKNGVISWSQYGQDLLIDKMLKQKRHGFFVEIGGFDGETFSNTLMLEKERDWSGLLVEANPYTYELMEKRDRKCYMLNACISNTVRNMTFIVGGALTSVKEITPNRHRKRIDKDAILYAKDETWRHAKENVVVNCNSLFSILESIGQTHIDYFSLDVEGAEMIILESIDWKHLDIDIFTIETDQHRQQILSFMKSRGFKWIQKIDGDDVFVKNKSIK